MDLLCCGTREELYDFVYKELKELQDFLETRKEGHENYYIVKVAKTYTKENYKNPNLSLQEVGDARWNQQDIFFNGFSGSDRRKILGLS